jgi:hypothetical protein
MKAINDEAIKRWKESHGEFSVHNFTQGANFVIQNRERQFKRALLKAWIEGIYHNSGFDSDLWKYMDYRSKRRGVRSFLLWYNKQTFEL